MSESPNIERPLFACDVARRFELTEAARPLLREDYTPQQFFAELAKRELYVDAIKLAAHYLTPREAIWWGCLSLWQVIRDHQSPPDVAALDAVVRWVQTPSDERRREAKRAGEATKSTSIAGSLARATFFAGGSISLPDHPHVAAPPDLTAQLVAEIELAAATQFVPPELKNACLRHFLQLAGEVSRGEAAWTNDEATQENSPTKPKELEHA